MAGVHIRLERAASDFEAQPYGAMSDRAGHFSIAGLPAGAYIVSARARGFFYMPPKGEEPVPRVSLKAGQQLTDLKIEMAQAAIISGRVLDDYGDPVQTTVQIESEAHAYANRYGMSDERGEFRISVAPGKYYVAAGPSDAVTRRGMAQPPEIRTDGSAEASYARTYYPGSAAKAKGAPVEAKAGAEIGGMDIHLLRQSRGATISGTVTGETDDPHSVMVFIRREDEAGLVNSQGGAVSSRTGHFQFGSLPPGTYWISALDFAGKTRLYGVPVTVQVEGSDIGGVTLALAPGGEITGSLEVAGAPATGKLSVGLVAGAFSGVFSGPVYGDSPAPADVDANGSFHIGGIAPGRYRVNVTPLPDNWYLKSVRLDGAEAANGELDLSRGVQSSSLKIVVSRNGGQISGKLLDKNGDPVGAVPMFVLLVDDPKEIDFERSLKETEDGTYRLQGIRPGKYRLLALDRFRGADFKQTAQRLAAAVEEIEIKEGDRKVKDLKVVSQEDADANPSQ